MSRLNAFSSFSFQATRSSECTCWWYLIFLGRRRSTNSLIRFFARRTWYRKPQAYQSPEIRVSKKTLKLVSGQNVALVTFLVCQPVFSHLPLDAHEVDLSDCVHITGIWCVVMVVAKSIIDVLLYLQVLPSVCPSFRSCIYFGLLRIHFLKRRFDH